MANRRAWEGDEWQAFALQLVQRRHGAENVQVVPDSVGGDAGLEFFTTSGCLYQCYAPEETSDVAKAASAMKAKARRDLPKLAKYKDKIEAILCGIPASRWFLLCPFLDNKDVVADVRKRGLALKAEGLSFLAADFEALCHSLDDFAGELEQLRTESLGTPLSVDIPTQSDILAAGETSIGTRIDEKLARAYGPAATDAQIAMRRDAYIKAHLYRENALDQLRQNHSVLWERAFQSLEAEETRLIAVGSSTTLPAEQLEASTERIEKSLMKALPTLSNGIVTQIAVGTVSDWLIRCPIDFPEAE
ncbi:MAG: hypothetical protein E5W91_32065 [Mesorhizobium sp.]|uniref:hypothetical protein n=1 Tax=Mesorhizobium sp. TaxID=1871066 RepID=UPI0012058350|nr:hypothetical protein [Mesorhizobium sp.]TIS53201.1 MAG: hypothetical protein E5W91_32065 [Mesorhizobium sp.]